MTCIECGSELTSKREVIKYDALGLPVTLANVEVRRCPRCGEYEIVIPKIETLHRLVATVVIRKPSRLLPREIVFLRKYLGWSGADFARRMGATPETVSRWENGKIPMGLIADRYLRLMVAHEKPVENYTLNDLEKVAKTAGKPVRMTLEANRGDWRVKAA